MHHERFESLPDPMLRTPIERKSNFALPYLDSSWPSDPLSPSFFPSPTPARATQIFLALILRVASPGKIT